MKGNWQNDLGLLILRLGVGVVAVYYGSQKLFGLFGGHGLHGTVQGMEKGMGIPPVFALLAIAGEFAGGLGMISGTLTRVAAFGFTCVMAVATYENWKTPGLIQDVFGKPDMAEPQKMFYSFVLLAGAAAVMLMGPGSYSIDARLTGGKKRKSGKSNK